MDVVLATLTVPDLAGALRQGGAHPRLGPYLNGGSYCEIQGVAGGADLALRAREAGLAVLEDPAPDDLASAGARGALCLLVTDEDGQTGPRVFLYGRSLPALGAIPACTLDDLRHTWAVLTGGTPIPGGRHLLHEQPEAWDPQIERQLTQRLRQLYGE